MVERALSYRSKFIAEFFAKGVLPFILRLHKRNRLDPMRLSAGRFGVTAPNANGDFVGAADTRDITGRDLHYGQHAFHVFVLIVLWLLSAMPAVVNATILGDAAAALSPGQWVKMLDGTGVGQMGNLNATGTSPAWDTLAGAPGPAYDGSQPGWNSTTRQIYIETTEHGRAGGLSPYCDADYWVCSWPSYPTAAWKPMWTYDDATNHWTVPATLNSGAYPNSSGNPVVGVHVWGGIAYDDGNQVEYIKAQETYAIQVYRYCAPTSPASYCAGQLGAWSPLPVFNPSSGQQLGQAMGFHRTYNGGSLMVFLNGGAGGTCASIIAYKEGSTGSNGTWTTLDDGAGCKFNAGDGPFLEGQYSTIKQVMVFLGSNSKAWRVTNAGAIQALDDSPCPMSTTNNFFATGAQDSNTGDIYILGCGNPGQLIKLNPTASPGSQWTTISSNLSTPGNICNANAGVAECASFIYATSISNYSVIGFWKYLNGSAEYWLFKPSAGGGDIVAPTVSVTVPTAGATVSGGSVTVSANASDNVGVVGVQFKVDGNNIGAEDTSSPYSISWNSASVANGSHTITAVARDAAGNSTTSTGVSITVSNAAGGSDFATRCAAPGVVRCVSFDSASQIACQTWGCNSGIDVTYAVPADYPVIDTSIKASGAGSLKFTQSTNTGAAGAGAYWTNFSDDLLTQFGAGESFYVQWRQRFSPELINTIYTQTCLPGPSCPGGNGNNAGGWKQISLTTGDSTTTPCPTIDANNGQCQVQLNEKKQQVSAYSSCTDIDVPTQNTNQRKMPQMYNACTPNASHGAPYWGIETYPGGDISFQSGRPSPFCLYTQGGQPNGGFFPPNGNCFPYAANEWMTFKVKITIGLRGAPPSPCSQPTCGSVTGASPNNVWGNSRIQLWVGREGQASQVIIDQNFDLGAGNSGQQKFGKIYLLPYHSYKNEAQVHPTAYTWYDDLIISTQDIADPGGSTVNPPANIKLTRRSQ